MKHFNFNLSLLSVTLASLPLVGCIDDNYDLSDIDSTARVQVKDLEVPVNLDAIELSNIFDLDEGSVIKEVGDAYCVLVDGSFNSAGIHVNKVDLGRPSVNPVSENISTSGVPSGVGPLPAIPVEFTIPTVSTSFSFSTSSVDKSIKSIERVTADWQITVDLRFTGITGIVTDMKVTGLTLQLPNGLVTPDYQNTNGVISLGDHSLTDGKLTQVIRVSGIDFSVLDASQFTFTPAADGVSPGYMAYSGEVGVKAGKLEGTTVAGATLPSSFSMTLSPELANIVIDSFTGDIEYALGQFDVSSVELNDLPDVLTQEDTDIRIANPQLYLAISNPLAGYGVDAHSGLTLTAVRPGEANQSYSSEEEITVGHDKGIAGPYNICLSPSVPSEYYQGYAGAQHVRFSGLSDVLSGKGLPDKINVDFNNARIGLAHVSDFLLGVDLSDVAGNYTFYAPLAFNPGSRIVYADSDDGWKDDTLDKITVEALGVTADVENDLPFDIILTGYPLDERGNQCVDPATKQPVTLGSVEVKGGQKTKISLKSSGTIKGLDGIRYSATATVDEGGQTLRPTTTIKLTNIRAIVSGYYEDEL